MNENDPHELNEVNQATPTDPRLDALLDEALAPEDAPAGLNGRIVAATADRLPGRADQAPDVLATIGGGFPWRSAAAALLFALILGGVWLTRQDADDPGAVGPVALHPIDDEDQPAVVLAPIEVETVLDQLAAAELESDWIDDRIEILSMQVAWAENLGGGKTGASGDAGGSGASGGGGWGVGAWESLDTAIARDEFDDLADEMELYF